MKALPYKLEEDGKTYVPCEAKEATHIKIKLPDRGHFFGCNFLPVLPNSKKREGTGNWSWNCNVDAPTIKPSLAQRHNVNGVEERCHTWITDGMVQFLSDSTHELANQTVSLEDITYED